VYAVNNGFLDTIQPTDVVAWEKVLHEDLVTTEKDLLVSLEKDWNDEIEGKLKKVLESFAKNHKKEL
jgi:F0F1-type ATP synthase alpha subunit